MKTLVIFDSIFGNTKIIAETVANELGASAIQVPSDIDSALEDVDLLIVGSPINGWRPSEKMLEFLGKLQSGQLKDVKATTFDTR